MNNSNKVKKPQTAKNDKKTEAPVQKVSVTTSSGTKVY